MENHVACYLPISFEQYQQMFQNFQPFAQARKDQWTESISIYQAIKKVEMKNNTYQKSMTRKFENSIIQIKKKDSTILAFTKAPLERIPDKILGETFFNEQLIQNASFMVTDHKYLTNALKTPVFSEIDQVKSIEILIQSFLIDQSLEVRIIRFEKELQERELWKKQISRVYQHNKLKQNQEHNDNQKKTFHYKIGRQYRSPRNILVEFISHNHCPEFHESEILKVSFSNGNNNSKVFIHQIEKLIRRSFLDPYEILKGLKNTKKQKIKDDYFEMVSESFSYTLKEMVNNNKEYAQTKNKINFWTIQAAYLAIFTLHPCEFSINNFSK